MTTPGGGVGDLLTSDLDSDKNYRVVHAVALLIVAAGTIGVLLDPENREGLFGGLTLAIHEGGHIVFGFLGWEQLTVAGGSLAQLLAPILCGVLLWYKQRDRVGALLMALWLGASMASLSVYIGDASAEALPLVSVGESDEAPIHDWNYLLDHHHMLSHDHAIAHATLRLAWLVWWAGAIGAVWYLARPRPPQPEPAAS